MEKEDIVKMLLKRIEIKGLLVEDLLIGLVFKKLDDLALASDNKLDDAVVAMVKPLLSEYIKDEIGKKIDELVAE